MNKIKPTDKDKMAARCRVKSTSEVLIAAAYSKGGSRPNKTMSEVNSICGMKGR